MFVQVYHHFPNNLYFESYEILFHCHTYDNAQVKSLLLAYQYTNDGQYCLLGRMVDRIFQVVVELILQLFRQLPFKFSKNYRSPCENYQLLVILWLVIVKLVKKYALYIAFLQAWIATLGSIYFSEIKHLTPCVLCWYQRILMFPIAVILAVAIIRKDKNVAYYVLPLSILGALVGFYQYLLQMTPLARINPISCSTENPCSAIDAIYFGFITIPFLSMT